MRRRLIGFILTFVIGVGIAHVVLDKGTPDLHRQIILYCGGLFALANGLVSQVFGKIKELYGVKGLDYWRKEKLVSHLDKTEQILSYEWILCFIASLVCLVVGFVIQADPRNNLYLIYIGYPFLLISIFSCLIGFVNYIQLNRLGNHLARNAEVAEMKAKQLTSLISGSSSKQFNPGDKQALPKI